MSTQEEREAAARKVFERPDQYNAAALLSLCVYDDGTYKRVYSRADGFVSEDVASVVASWLAHVRALDAKAAAQPADPLEGVVWQNPEWVIWYTTKGVHPQPREVGDDRARAFDIIWKRMVPRGGVNAHARAQLARESAPAQPPALTLEQARAMCRGAGDTVVEAPPRPNYVKPAEMLAWFEASVAVRKADKHMGDAASRCAMQDRDAWTETPDDCTVESEIGRLRALGVTPAVLS